MFGGKLPLNLGKLHVGCISLRKPLVLRWLVVGFGGELVFKWFNIQIPWGKLGSLECTSSTRDHLFNTCTVYSRSQIKTFVPRKIRTEKPGLR